MPSSLSTLLIVAFASLLLGVVAGLLLGALRGDPQEETRPEQETPPGGRSGRYLPVVRLWREKTSETMIVEMEGKSYLLPEPLTMDQRERLEKAASELAGWLGVVVGNAPVQLPAASRPAEGQVVLPAAQLASAPAADRVSVEPAQPVPATPPANPAYPVASPTLTGQRQVTPQTLSPVSMAAPVKEEPKSIVGQIGAILQDMLLSSGLDSHGVSLTEDPRKGVVVWIGLDHFDGIDAVTDAEIKGIIRSAVGEWERRQERNLRH